MNDQQADEILSLIAATWPDPAMPNRLIALWQQALAPIPAADALHAYDTLATTTAFRPTITAFTQTATGTTQPPIDQAHQAYLACMRGETDPNNLHPAIRDTMHDLGGYAYCRQQPADWHERFRTTWKRRHGDTNPLTTTPPPAIEAHPDDRRGPTNPGYLPPDKHTTLIQQARNALHRKPAA